VGTSKGVSLNFKSIILTIFIFGAASPAASFADESSAREVSFKERLNRFFYSNGERTAKPSTPEEVAEKAMDLVRKDSESNFERFIYARPHSKREHVQKDSKKLFTHVNQILDLAGQQPHVKIHGPNNELFNMLNNNTWSEQESQYTVLFYNEKDQPIGEIPVICYTLRNCIGQTVTQYCGAEL